MKYFWQIDMHNSNLAHLNVDRLLPFAIHLYDNWPTHFHDEDKAWYNNLCDIHGVESVVVVHKYCLTVTKGLAFEWEPIKDAVMELTKEYLSPNNKLININPQDIKS